MVIPWFRNRDRSGSVGVDEIQQWFDTCAGKYGRLVARRERALCETDVSCLFCSDRPMARQRDPVTALSVDGVYVSDAAVNAGTSQHGHNLRTRATDISMGRTTARSDQRKSNSNRAKSRKCFLRIPIKCSS